MKIPVLVLLIVTLLSSCKEGSFSDDANAEIGDTIQTPSGLKYIYLKKGSGSRIEEGSKVSVYNRLYLNDSQDVFWSTDQSKDSVFTFIQGKTPLIKGASELYSKLRQGDKVIAIMPDSIGYGKAGGSGVPPMTRLVFNPIEIRTVSPPKLLLSDTLYRVGTDKGAKAAIAKYLELKTGEPEVYHMELELLYDLFDRLASEGAFDTVKDLAIYFEQQAQSKENLLMFAYFKLVATEQLGNIKETMDYLNQYIESFPEEIFFANYKARLAQRLNQTQSTP